MFAPKKLHPANILHPEHLARELNLKIYFTKDYSYVYCESLFDAHKFIRHLEALNYKTYNHADTIPQPVFKVLWWL